MSGLATTTEAEGVDKGAEISTFASGGKSRAGADHATPQGAEGDADADTTGHPAPDAHPDNGGTTTADESSSGRNAAGSGHRP